jgi:hypothetical protein
MQNYVKNEVVNSDVQLNVLLNQLTKNQLISEEEKIAIELEYMDEPQEFWKVHLAKSN